MKYFWSFLFSVSISLMQKEYLEVPILRTQSKLFKWNCNAKEHTWCKIILHWELNTFVALELWIRNM